MEINGVSEREKLGRAKKRVEQLKGFYWHLGIYLIVNLFISISKMAHILGTNGWTNFEADFFDFGLFATWFFWGIGLAFHAIKVFSLNPVFGKDWEEKQIQKFIAQEKNEIEKYR